MVEQMMDKQLLVMRNATKRCTACGEVKHLSEFHRKNVAADGRQSRCKACNTLKSERRKERAQRTSKRCTLCLRFKPLSAYYRNHKSADGHQSRCKQCYADRNRKSKRCTVCGEVKPLTEYNRRSKSPDGLQYTCRPCQWTLYRQRYGMGDRQSGNEQQQNREQQTSSIGRGAKRSFEYPAYSLVQRSILMRLYTAHENALVYPAHLINADAARRLISDGLITQEQVAGAVITTMAVTALGARTIPEVLRSPEGYLTMEILQGEIIQERERTQ